MVVVLQRVVGSKQAQLIAGRLRAGGVVKLAGVWGSSAPMLGAALAAQRNCPVVLFVCPHLDDADAIADDVEVLTGLAVEQFPAWEVALPMDAEDGAALPPDHVSDEITGERLRICGLLAPGSAARGRADASPAGNASAPPGKGFPIIVASVAALLQPVPTRQTLASAGLPLRKGLELDPEKLAQWLVDSGFEPVESVDQQGEFARRGGIIDIFPPGASQPLRVEFFGDTIESLRRFDLDTLRSAGEVQGYDLVGLAAGRPADPAASSHLLDYLPDDTLICMVEPIEVVSLAATFYRRLEAESAVSGEGGPPVGMHRPEVVWQALRRFAVLETFAFGPPEGSARQAEYLPMGIVPIPHMETTSAEALAELDRLSEDNEIRVYCDNQAEGERLLELLRPTHGRLSQRVKLGLGHIRRGFHWTDERLVVVGHHEIFHRYALPRQLRRIRTGRPIDSFVDLEEGDYVVHVAHGIARFEGLRTLTKHGRKEEFLTLRFAENALLHVPVTEIQLVQKYIGARRGHPPLSHLGGSTWSIRKQKVAEAVKDLAAELLRIQAMRAAAPGTSYTGRSDWLRQFEEEFLYEETEDQLASMQQIYKDMAEPRPMDRLLCGDVGFGKTELAMRAAFRVAEAGRQVAVLVPTTVLAAQHYRTFKERFADYPFTVDVISRFRTKVEQTAILGRAQDGRIDILIGTHRILSSDVRFRDLGLVIIDEEHKEHLKRLRAAVEVLTMTATPIPRTLHMALLGLRDISNLATPPLDRRAIHTQVCQPADERIRAGILREMARGGQVFFVHNKVHNIESAADHVRRLAPEARVAVGHGQMSERLLEKTMFRFVRHDVDVLVCTTIIEAGLDIPSANTMFVNEADRFGLSQLHQLRGRIGRYKHRAYCYLMLPKTRPVSKTAAKRLKTVEEFSDLGAGFQIAMRDLEIRGAGNILGSEQSGHIAAVGYELYCRLLEGAVRQLRGEQPEMRAPEDVHVELGVEALIPRGYVAAGRQRMEVYRRLASCLTVADIEQLTHDLADAYGKLPHEVEMLLGVAEVRVLAGRLGIRSMVLMPPDLICAVPSPAEAERALKGLIGTLRMPDATTAHWRPPPAYLQQPTLLTVLRKHLRKAVEALAPRMGKGARIVPAAKDA